jgi:hypothetical protein
MIKLGTLLNFLLSIDRIKEYDYLYKIANDQTPEEYLQGYPGTYEIFQNDNKPAGIYINLLNQIKSKFGVEDSDIDSFVSSQASTFLDIISILKSKKDEDVKSKKDSIFSGLDLSEGNIAKLEEISATKEEVDFIYNQKTRGAHLLEESIGDLKSIKSIVDYLLSSNVELEKTSVTDFSNMDEAMQFFQDKKFDHDNAKMETSRGKTLEKLERFYKYIYDGYVEDGHDYEGYEGVIPGIAKDTSRIVYSDEDLTIVRSDSKEACQYWERGAVSVDEKGRPKFETCTSRIEDPEGFGRENLYHSYSNMAIFQVLKGVTSEIPKYKFEMSSPNDMITMCFNPITKEVLWGDSYTVNAEDSEVEEKEFRSFYGEKSDYILGIIKDHLGTHLREILIFKPGIFIQNNLVENTEFSDMLEEVLGVATIVDLNGSLFEDMYKGGDINLEILEKWVSLRDPNSLMRSFEESGEGAFRLFFTQLAESRICHKAFKIIYDTISKLDDDTVLKFVSKMGSLYFKFKDSTEGMSELYEKVLIEMGPENIMSTYSAEKPLRDWAAACGDKIFESINALEGFQIGKALSLLGEEWSAPFIYKHAKIGAENLLDLVRKISEEYSQKFAGEVYGIMTKNPDAMNSLVQDYGFDKDRFVEGIGEVVISEIDNTMTDVASKLLSTDYSILTRNKVNFVKSIGKIDPVEFFLKCDARYHYGSSRESISIINKHSNHNVYYNRQSNRTQINIASFPVFHDAIPGKVSELVDPKGPYYSEDEGRVYRASRCSMLSEVALDCFRDLSRDDLNSESYINSSRRIILSALQQEVFSEDDIEDSLDEFAIKASKLNFNDDQCFFTSQLISRYMQVAKSETRKKFLIENLDKKYKRAGFDLISIAPSYGGLSVEECLMYFENLENMLLSGYFYTSSEAEEGLTTASNIANLLLREANNADNIYKYKIEIEKVSPGVNSFFRKWVNHSRVNRVSKKAVRKYLESLNIPRSKW